MSGGGSSGGGGAGGSIDAGDYALHSVTSRRRWTVVIVQLAVPEHAALVVVMAGSTTLAKLIVAPESTRRRLAVVPVVVGIRVSPPTTSGHRGRMCWARTRCAASSRRAGVTRRSRPRGRFVAGKPATRIRYGHPGVETATLPPGRNPSNNGCTIFHVLICVA